MRNVFDQYDQPENRLTHALVSTLENDKSLLRPFLRWLKSSNVPSLKSIHIIQQQVPGQEEEYEKEGQDGLPDACFYDDQGWAVLIESKVQAKISLPQLKRHFRTAARHGYENAKVVLISVDSPPKSMPREFLHVFWRSVYQWFTRYSLKSKWARRFVEYMNTFEAKMNAQEYNIRGTLTMFSGFHFDKEHPYTYLEGKRLIKLIRQEFCNNKRLVRELGLDPQNKGRSAITRGDSGVVWDLIPLKRAKGKAFTAYPHATMAIWPKNAEISITIPNGMKSGIKKRLKQSDLNIFYDMVVEIENNVRDNIKETIEAKPVLRILQRRFKSQRSIPEKDGIIEVDLRTLVDNEKTGLKHQPMWLEAIYQLLINKRTNIQLQICVYLPYSAKAMRTTQALDVMANAWIAMKPLLKFILQEEKSPDRRTLRDMRFVEQDPNAFRIEKPDDNETD